MFKHEKAKEEKKRVTLSNIHISPSPFLFFLFSFSLVIDVSFFFNRICDNNVIIIVKKKRSILNELRLEWKWKRKLYVRVCVS